MINKLVWIVVTVALVLFLISIFKKDSYIGFYYPDRGNLMNDIQSNTSFKSLEECRAWVNYQISIHNKTNQNYDYECGKNCDLQNGQKPYICEETLR